jgi:hypothetical protein
MTERILQKSNVYSTGSGHDTMAALHENDKEHLGFVKAEQFITN